MADATYTSVKTSNGAGFGARLKASIVSAFKAMAEAREEEARRQVAYYLAIIDGNDKLGAKGKRAAL